MAEVIALAGWPPEVLAYAFAMYSRSSLSIKQSIAKITQEKSSKFFESYYFGYGHKSIADNAHIPLALENISEIAAYELEDEQLWDGQERSTRYQDFAGPDAYFIPGSVRGTPMTDKYSEAASFLLAKYAEYSKRCFEWLVANNLRPQDMKEDVYERTLRARAFDVSRYWLFNGILTNVGQITSARTLEEQISRLTSLEYPELRELGLAMKRACTEKPFCPEGKDEPPIAPTLVKYAAPNQFREKIREIMTYEVNNVLSCTCKSRQQRYVELAADMSLTDEILATLFYEASNYSYKDILDVVTRVMDTDWKTRIISRILEWRGQHDQLPRTFADGYKLQFDIAMDRGGERDLHRHRNCIQIHQRLTTKRGWDTLELIKKIGLADDYNAGMLQVSLWVNDLGKEIGVDANYLIPFAFRSGTLYKMHLAENVYISELRSGTQGHFSYREVACQMHDQLIKLVPALAGKIRITPFEQENLLKR